MPPLMQGKSPKAFSKNVSVEMHAGKPQKQALAIAYSVKRKNAKKMARGGAVKQHATEGEMHSDSKAPIVCAHGGEAHCNMGCYAAGGIVEISASNEARPGTETLGADSAETSRNRGNKALKQADWTDDTYSDQASRSFSDPQRKQDTDFVSESRTNIDDAATSEDEDMLDGHPTRHAQDITANDERRANAYARGGEVGNPKLQQSRMEPDDADEHYSNLADAILAKKRKKMADGGMVDLEANSEEDLNNEDQMSYQAGGKEQYDLRQLGPQPMDSNETGDSREEDEENQHDRSITDAIRSRMKSRRGR